MPSSLQLYPIFNFVIRVDQYGSFITCMQCGFSKDIFEKLADPVRLA
jgi:hypothetical protein